MVHAQFLKDLSNNTTTFKTIILTLEKIDQLTLLQFYMN